MKNLSEDLRLKFGETGLSNNTLVACAVEEFADAIERAFSAPN